MEVERGSFHWKDKDYADIEVKEKQETGKRNGNISHSKQYDFLKQFRLNDINFSIEKVRVKSNLASKTLVVTPSMVKASYKNLKFAGSNLTGSLTRLWVPISF